MLNPANLRGRRLLILALLIVSIAGVFTVSAQTTGILDGKVTDESGGPLPGVTVIVTGENLIGSRSVTTNTDGVYRFPSLPPGIFKVRATLSSFTDAEKTGIHVGIDKLVTQNLQLKLSVEGVEVTVIGETPVVDQSSTTTGANIGRELFETLPLGRNFTSIVEIAPGTNSDDSGTTVYGSTGAENTYIIDGLNSTDIAVGTEGKNINLEMIQEVEVKTGGYQAEYGRATGGIINVVTKSGGNEFVGDAFFYMDNNSFQGQEVGIGDDVSATTIFPYQFTTGAGYDRYDYGLDVGGYILKDRLWFFAAYDRVDRTNKRIQIKDYPVSVYCDECGPVAGEHLDTPIIRNLFDLKLTWRITDNATSTLAINGDPRSIKKGAAFGYIDGNGPYSAILLDSKDGSTDYLLKFDYVGGSSLLVNFLAGKHNEKYEQTPGTADGGALPQYYNLASNQFNIDGGVGFLQNQNLSRTTARLDVTKFLSGLGDHEFKIGADAEYLKADITNRYTGTVGGDPALYPVYTTNLGGNLYEHRFYTNGNADPNHLTLDDIRPEFAVTPKTRNYSVYAQDSWKVGPRFTVNAGLRWEKQNLIDQRGETRISISDNWAPRLGLIFDVTGSGSSKVYASAGYFYESIPMDINIRALGGEVTGTVYNGKKDDPLDLSGRNDFAVIFSGEGEPIDKGLKGQYVAEYILGYDVAVTSKFAVGVKGVYRSLERIIEDRFASFDDNGNPIYAIGNPGRGDFKTGLYCSFTGCYAGLSADERNALFVPVPAPKRYYKGLEISATKRLADNWQMLASYTYSKLEGNYDGAFQASTGQLDPNINSAYDYANFLDNAYGYLSGDRRHQFKLNGSYIFPFKLTTGFSFHYQTGRPFNRMGYWNGYGNWEVYLDKRGEGQAVGPDGELTGKKLGRHPDDYELDLHFGYPLNLGPTIVQLELDVFRFLNRRENTDRYEFWSLSETANTSTNRNDPGVFSGYGRERYYQAPSAIRLSARVSF